MTRFIDAALLYYSNRLPYHAGKWRIVAGLTSLFGSPSRVPRPVRVRRGGLEWELDISCMVQRSVYYLGLYEVHESAWLRTHVQPEWVCMDIGANFGYFSVLLAGMTAGGGGRVIAFEPSPELNGKLRRNLELNALTNVAVEELALSDRAGNLRFVIAGDENQGLGHLQQPDEKGQEPGGGGGGRVIEVRTDTLDHYVESNAVTRIDFLKADVEGAECAVLDGGQRTLATLRPAMLIELNPSALRRAGSSGDEMLRRIRALGYQSFALHGTRLRPLDDASVVTDYCNLLCLHPEAHAGLMPREA